MPSPRSILVTGTSGVVGRAVVDRLAVRPGRLRLLVRHTLPTVVGAEVLRGDVRDPAIVRAALEGIGVVVHLAGQTSGWVADEDPAGDWETNVAPLLEMLEAGRCDGIIRTILLAGSETQAGPTPPVPLDESAPDQPVTIYDLHKLHAEQLLETYVRRGLAHGTCLRLPTVYGAGPASEFAGRGMVSALARRALAGRPLQVYGAGDWRRDFLHARDVAAAFLSVLDHLDAVDGRHFLLGTGEGVTVGDAVRRVAKEVSRHTGRPPVPISTVPVPVRWSAIDERDVVVDAAAFRKATGWAPAHDFASGLAETVKELAWEASWR